jgi:hypothetical protein
MEDFRLDSEDPILPVRITHNCEQLWYGNSLAQDYNYLLYDFETQKYLYQARAYLHEIHTVAVYGPYEKDLANSLPLEGGEIEPRVLAYLRRRYLEITRLGPAGNVSVEPMTDAQNPP